MGKLGTSLLQRRKIRRHQKYISREDSFRRDLPAFHSLEEYLKTKVHGTQIFVHFHHNGETLAATSTSSNAAASARSRSSKSARTRSPGRSCDLIAIDTAWEHD